MVEFMVMVEFDACSSKRRADPARAKERALHAWLLLVGAVRMSYRRLRPVRNSRRCASLGALWRGWGGALQLGEEKCAGFALREGPSAHNRPGQVFVRRPWRGGGIASSLRCTRAVIGCVVLGRVVGPTPGSSSCHVDFGPLLLQRVDQVSGRASAMGFCCSSSLPPPPPCPPQCFPPPPEPSLPSRRKLPASLRRPHSYFRWALSTLPHPSPKEPRNGHSLSMVRYGSSKSSLIETPVLIIAHRSSLRTSIVGSRVSRARSGSLAPGAGRARQKQVERAGGGAVDGES
jgi:hypothetical protein